MENLLFFIWGAVSFAAVLLPWHELEIGKVRRKGAEEGFYSCLDLVSYISGGIEKSRESASFFGVEAGARVLSEEIERIEKVLSDRERNIPKGVRKVLEENLETMKLVSGKMIKVEEGGDN